MSKIKEIAIKPPDTPEPLKTPSFVEKMGLNPILEITHRQRVFIEKLQKDKEICENDNIWYNITESELESKEYEIKQLREQLKKQGQTIKDIHKLTNKFYTEPKPQKPVLIAFADTESVLFYFKTYLKPLLNELFNESNAYKWECILKGQTPPEPIAIKTTLKGFRYFISKLEKYEIIKPGRIKQIVKINAFTYTGRIITIDNMEIAQKENSRKPPKIADRIDEFFESKFK